MKQREQWAHLIDGGLTPAGRTYVGRYIRSMRRILERHKRFKKIFLYGDWPNEPEGEGR